MGGIGADSLVPFGGHIPSVFQADAEAAHDREDSARDEWHEGIHVVGADPIPPSTTPDRQVDPDIGTVPGSPNRGDPDAPEEMPDPRDPSESGVALQQSRLDDEQPVDVQAAVDAIADPETESADSRTDVDRSRSNTEASG